MQVRLPVESALVAQAYRTERSAPPARARLGRARPTLPAPRRQELPWVRIDNEYRFETDEGTASLADLFRGRSQFLVYHFMFGPDYTAGCPS